MRRWIAFVVCALVAHRAQAVEPRVLATTGTVVDGFGVGALEDPRAANDGDVVVRATQTSLAIGGLTFTSGVAAAGVPGIVESVQQGAVAGDAGAVLLSLSGSDRLQAIVLVQAGAAEPLVTVDAAAGEGIRRFVMNPSGDVAWLVRTGAGYELRVRPRATGTVSVVSGPDRKYLKTLRGLVMDDAGAVAWMDRASDVSHWDATHGTRRIAGVGTPRRLRGRSPIALHASFGLGFVGRRGAVRWSPENGTVVATFAAPAIVDGVAVRYLNGGAGFLDDGRLSVAVRAKRASTVEYVCVASPPTVCDGPGVAAAGVEVAPERSTALLQTRDGGPTLLLRSGDPVSGAGTVENVSDHVVDGRDVTFLGSLADGRTFVGRWRAGVVDALASDGPRRSGTTMTLSGLYAVERGTVLVGLDLQDPSGSTPRRATGLALLRGRGGITPVLGPRGRDLAPSDVTLGGGRVYAIADGELFRTRGRALVPVPIPGGVTDAPSLGPLFSDGSHVGVVVGRGDTDVAVYAVSGHGARRRGALPGVPYFVAADGRDVAADVWATDDGGLTWVERIVTLDGSRTRPVLDVGAATAAGVVAGVEGLAMTRADVVVAARLTGSGARHAILAVPRP